MTRLVLRLGGHPVREIPLKPGRNVLGRSSKADVFLEDAGTSRQHCELELTDEQLVLRDLGSTNGTFLDGQPVREAIIRPGQVLKVGELEFAFRDLPARVAIPAPAPAPPPPPETLPDGTRCCRQHADRPALFACPKCGTYWCMECVRIVGRPGGRRHAFCSGCDALCGFLPEVARRYRRGRIGWAGRVSGWARKCSGWFRNS